MTFVLSMLLGIVFGSLAGLCAYGTWHWPPNISWLVAVVVCVVTICLCNSRVRGER